MDAQQAKPSEISVHDLAARIDRHYNALSTLRADFQESYTGMGQTRQEHGALLLKKPGRMRWTYADGKLFLLDGKFATSYTPGDLQAQRVSAKQLDDLRSPLRFLLGHTAVEKELDRIVAAPAANGRVTLTGVPRYRLAPAGSEDRVQSIGITAEAATGAITALRLVEVDGTVTEFRFDNMRENTPAPDTEFRFQPPAGVTVVNGIGPA